MKKCVADQERRFPVIFPVGKRVHRSKLMVQRVDIDFKKKNSAVFQSGSRHYASMGDTSSQTNYT